MTERKDIPIEQTWNLSLLYKGRSDWEKERAELGGFEASIQKFRGSLRNLASEWPDFFEAWDRLSRRWEKLYVYTHLRVDEDLTDGPNLGMDGEIQSEITQMSARLAWIEPEILSLPEAKQEEIKRNPAMESYQRALELIIREKPHTLTEAEEKILSLASEPLSGSQKVFSMINNADLIFPEVTDEDGKSVRLTHGNYLKFLESPNRNVRKSASEALTATYQKHQNALAATLDNAVRTHVFYARVRKHSTALEASLHADRIGLQVYEKLIETAHEHLPVFHQYLDLHRKRLGVDRLEMYDLFAPTTDFRIRVPYQQACEWVLESLAPLGADYQKHIETAFRERWIDWRESKGKRSGAYSSGCYDSPPYILMNYNEELNDAFTLTHELGHSMHSLYSNRAQSHIYARYRIFVAEVASTTNELLLQDYLLKKATNEGNTLFVTHLLNQACSSFRTTLFRQTQFAEYEKFLHEKVEAGQTLTPQVLNESYLALNRKYYGTPTNASENSAIEWARIPHFYYNFYVYKYATGFSAAQAFAKRILSGDPTYLNQYLSFLKAGNSKDPLEILQDAGVDLSTSQPIRSALENFKTLIDRLAAC